MAERTRKPRLPAPGPGSDAVYIGKTSPLLKGGHRVHVVAEASRQRVVVEAIGYKGRPVRFTVMQINLAHPEPDFFD